MLIYRVENFHGEGMYCGSTGAYACDMIEDMHLMPEEDAGLSAPWKKIMAKGFDYYTRWSFAFGSIEQLKSWIYQEEWRKQIDKDGFRIYVYETHNYYIGDTQAVFMKADAKLSHSLSFKEI